jgi:hypothetical protein
VSEWFALPSNALLSVRRQARAGAREQWVIVRRDGALILQGARPEDGTWQEVGSFRTIEDALAGTPELRELRKGVVTFFNLAAQADISELDLAALLDLCPQEGSDNPADWSAAELDACGWEDFEVWHRAKELPLIRRLASVNELKISGISHARECVPVLADEDGFVALDVPAESGTRAHPGVSMVGWEGGSDLMLLAPGVACSVPWGDELDFGDNGFFLIDYPEQGTPEEVAAAIAGWLTNIKFDFWAALVLEPLDPEGTLDDQGREAWAAFEDGTLTASPVLRVPEGIEPLLRAELTRLSDSYARCAQARANPAGRIAQIMRTSDQPDLHYGNWIRQL